MTWPFESEEFNLEGGAEAPSSSRQKASAPIAEAFGLGPPPAPPKPVADLTERIEAARDALLTRRRSGWS